jgi:hypothetical protein
MTVPQLNSHTGRALWCSKVTADRLKGSALKKEYTVESTVFNTMNRFAASNLASCAAMARAR